MVRAGTLRERITINAKRTTIVTNDSGEDITPYDVVIAQTWGEVKPLTQREQSIAKTAGSTATYQITTRYRTDVTNEHRIVWGSHTLSIDGIVPDERKRQLTISCKEYKK